MAFLRSYADDSASEEGDRRLFMAGYLNRAEKWALFSEAWFEELHAIPAIDYLHMVEAQNFRGQFDKREGWTGEKRDEKLRGLARVIRHFEPLSFEFSLNREIFYRDLKSVSPRGLGNPNFTGCFAVVAGLARFAASERGNIPIEFIFDEQEGVEADIALFFLEMKKSLPKKARKLIAGIPMFRNDKDHEFMPLQAADMLAWHLRREHEVCAPPERLPMAELLRADGGHLMSEVDEAMMKRWSDHHSRLPGISQLQSKAQWRAAKGEIARLLSLGIDPSTMAHRRNLFQRARVGFAKFFRRG